MFPEATTGAASGISSSENGNGSELAILDSTNQPTVGMRVLRRFAGFGEFWGSIVAMQQPDGVRTWYRVDYDDGDSEEYNLKEVTKIVDYARSQKMHDPQPMTVATLAFLQKSNNENAPSDDCSPPSSLAPVTVLPDL